MSDDEKQFVGYTVKTGKAVHGIATVTVPLRTVGKFFTGQVPLPDGYTVEADRLVGASYRDPAGHIVLQHPNDSNVARKLLWKIVGVLEQEKENGE
jgi:hypothetical protein